MAEQPANMPDGSSERILLDLLQGKTLKDLVGVKDETRTNLAEAQKLIRDLHSGSHDLVVNALRTIITDADTRASLPGLNEIEFEARPHHVNTALARVALQADVPVWLHGEAGSGKTTTGEVAASALGLDVRSISLGPTTSKADLLGYRDATGEYHDTGFRRMYEDGGVFIFDEIDNAHPSILTILNSSVANSIGEFPDARVTRSDKTRFVATANTIGRGATAQYVGRAPIDAATIDRFAFVPMDIDPALEEALILGNGYHSNDVDIAEGDVPSRREWLARVRANRDAAAELGIRTIISQRASLYGVRLAELGVGTHWLNEMLIYKGMNSSDREKLEKKATELYAAHFNALKAPEPKPEIGSREPIEPANAQLLARGAGGPLHHGIALALGDLYSNQMFQSEWDEDFIVAFAWQAEKQFGKSIFDTDLRYDIEYVDTRIVRDTDALINDIRLMPKPLESVDDIKVYDRNEYDRYFGQYLKYLRDKDPAGHNPVIDDILPDIEDDREWLINAFVNENGFYPGPTSLGWWIVNQRSSAKSPEKPAGPLEPTYEGLPDYHTFKTDFNKFLGNRLTMESIVRDPRNAHLDFIESLMWRVEKEYGVSLFTRDLPPAMSWLPRIQEGITDGKISSIDDIMNHIDDYAPWIRTNYNQTSTVPLSRHKQYMELRADRKKSEVYGDWFTSPSNINTLKNEFTNKYGFYPGPSSLTWYFNNVKNVNA